MAIQAKSHAKRLIMIDFLHLIDLAVAFDATNAAIHVHRMIEIDEIRSAMNLYPGNWLATGRAFANEGEARVVFEHLIMAIHTGAAGGNVRIPRLFNGVVAVAAIDAKLPVMCGMRESDGLNGLITDAGVFGSKIVPRAGDQRGPDQHSADHDQPGQTVSPLGENCRHLVRLHFPTLRFCVSQNKICEVPEPLNNPARRVHEF